MNFNFNINTRGANSYGANNEFTSYTRGAKKEVNRYLFNGVQDFQKTNEEKTSFNALGIMISDIVAEVLENATKEAEQANGMKGFEMLADNGQRLNQQF